MVTQIIICWCHLSCLQTRHHRDWTQPLSQKKHSYYSYYYLLPTVRCYHRAPGSQPQTQHNCWSMAVLCHHHSTWTCPSHPFLTAEALEEDEETPQLMRTKSDAACEIQRRPRHRTPGEAQRVRRHRFSINGHFYNHKVMSQPCHTPGP